MGIEKSLHFTWALLPMPMPSDLFFSTNPLRKKHCYRKKWNNTNYFVLVLHLNLAVTHMLFWSEKKEQQPTSMYYKVDIIIFWLSCAFKRTMIKCHLNNDTEQPAAALENRTERNKIRYKRWQQQQQQQRAKNSEELLHISKQWAERAKENERWVASIEWAKEQLEKNMWRKSSRMTTIYINTRDTYKRGAYTTYVRTKWCETRFFFFHIFIISFCTYISIAVQTMFLFRWLLCINCFSTAWNNEYLHTFVFFLLLFFCSISRSTLFYLHCCFFV